VSGTSIKEPIWIQAISLGQRNCVAPILKERPAFKPEPISAREDLASGLAMGLFSGCSKDEGPKPHLS
jgi:hypothetical protein